MRVRRVRWRRLLKVLILGRGRKQEVAKHGIGGVLLAVEEEERKKWSFSEITLGLFCNY